jgi:hypothetical protein
VPRRALQLSDEERERRRRVAQELHAAGRFGGPQPGSGRPRKKRASELVAEEAEKNAAKIVQVFKDGIGENVPISSRLQAARDWLAVEEREERMRIDEEKALEGMHRDQLIGVLADRLTKLFDAGVISSPVLEGHAEEIEAGDVD